jgi:hypothetical protein
MSKQILFTRFICFSGHPDFLLGGMSDYKTTLNKVSEVLEFAKRKIKCGHWVQVLDLQENEIIEFHVRNGSMGVNTRDFIE